MKTLKILSTLPLFCELDGKQRHALAQAARTKYFDKGQTLLRAGQTPEVFSHILAGQLKRTMAPGSSNEKVLELLFAGQSFGEAELLAQRPCISDIVAIEPGLLLCVDACALHELIDSNPAFTARLLSRLAQRQIDLETDTLADRSLNGTQRILDYLMLQAGSLSGSHGETRVQLPTSKQLIAAHLGLTPETFSRSLRELGDIGLVIVQGRDILLQNARIIQFLERGNLHKPGKDLARLNDTHDTHDTHGTHYADYARLRPRILQNAVLQDDLRIQHAALENTLGKVARLRMLTQRMAKSWLMQGRGILLQRARATLRLSIKEFEQQLDELAKLAEHKEIHAAHKAVRKLWTAYKTLLGSPSITPNVRKLFRLNEKILLTTQQLMHSFEHSTRPTDTAGGTSNRLLRLASDNRLLSERMAKLYMFLEWEKSARSGIDRPQCQQELQATMAVFEANLQLLAEEARAHPKIGKQVGRAMAQWRLMHVALNNTDGHPPELLSADVYTSSERLLKTMDTAIALYESKAAV